MVPGLYVWSAQDRCDPTTPCSGWEELTDAFAQTPFKSGDATKLRQVQFLQRIETHSRRQGSVLSVPR